jgi:hypothetical protein
MNGDAPTPGIDRRAALRKVAVGGTVAWTAPTLLNSAAVAQGITMCSAPCAPFDTSDVTISISVAVEPCTDIRNPGDEAVFGTVTQTGYTGAPCPCSPSIVSIITPIPGTVEQLSPGPGNWDGSFPLAAVIDCVDANGQPIRRFCTATATIGASGNCESLGGNTYTDETILLDCNPPRCT